MSKKKGILHGNALSKTEILDLAEIFAKNIEKGDIILVEGPIGIGKTFFSRAIINARCLIDKLEIEEVPSPTFSIIQEYDLKYFSILHLDLYRLEIETDLLAHVLHENSELNTLCTTDSSIVCLTSNRLLYICSSLRLRGNRLAFAVSGMNLVPAIGG